VSWSIYCQDSGSCCLDVFTGELHYENNAEEKLLLLAIFKPIVTTEEQINLLKYLERSN
jgi:hypothetical protein